MSIIIDKSRFTAEQRAQYEELVRIGKADTDSADPTPAVENDPMEETKKSFTEAMKSANERMEALEKSIAMKEFSELAKKYAPLGEKEDELATNLYEMKKSSPEHYDAYIKVLDKSLGMVEKSGVFAEIGKSYSGPTAGGAVAKIENAATEIQKADPTMSRVEAIAKAWEDHPELVAEYDAEYKA